jgi:hypothetical protein
MISDGKAFRLRRKRRATAWFGLGVVPVVDLNCPTCGLRGGWSTPIGLAKHQATCKGGVQ